MTIRTFALAAATFIALVPGFSAHAEDLDTSKPVQTLEAPAQDRLLIVNGSTGRVVYDDGRNDLFCVTRYVVVGYNYWGQPIRQPQMHCR